MLTQGYILEHVQVEERTGEISREIGGMFKPGRTADIEDVPEQINEWKESIDEIYDLLENEVIAKQRLDKRIGKF